MRRIPFTGIAFAVLALFAVSGCAVQPGGVSYATPNIYQPIYAAPPVAAEDYDQQDTPVYLADDPNVPYWTLWDGTTWQTLTFRNEGGIIVWYDRYHHQFHRGDWVPRQPPAIAYQHRPRLEAHPAFGRGLPNHAVPHPVVYSGPPRSNQARPNGNFAAPARQVNNQVVPQNRPQSQGAPAQPQRQVQQMPQPQTQPRPAPQAQPRPAPQQQQHQQQCGGYNQPRCPR